MTDATSWQAEVLRFWFGLDDQQWWSTDDALDQAIRENFQRMWKKRRSQPASSYLDAPLTALAAVVLFDQFPRNMFRGHADQYSSDDLALQIAKGAIERGFDDQLDKDERAFLYMPFQHSESRDDQRQSVLLFTALGDARYLDFARKHHDVIERFGRFPHRNEVLARQPRAEELAAGDVTPF